MPKSLFYLLVYLGLFASAQVYADTTSAPWGVAKVTPTEYKPQKVVYDVHVKTVESVNPTGITRPGTQFFRCQELRQT